MFNKFKNNQCVIVNGFGKCNNKLYQDAIGTVICRDPYYLDYNIRFEDGTDDKNKFLQGSLKTIEENG